MTQGTPNPNLALPPTLACDLPMFDPRDMAAAALEKYLLSLVFQRFSGDYLTPNLKFQLDNVQHEWPEATKELTYPCASIIDYGPGAMGASNFTPVCLEDTFELYGTNTVLWQLGELECDLQVDFWCNDIPTRNAVAGGLMRAFAPGELSYGVILFGPEGYYPETTRIRATLMSYQRMDDADTAFVRERRLMTMIRIQCPIMDLRSTRLGSFVAQSVVGPGETASCCKET